MSGQGQGNLLGGSPGAEGVGNVAKKREEPGSVQGREGGETGRDVQMGASLMAQE